MHRLVLPPAYREDLLKRFLRYVVVHTTSNGDAPPDQCPSSICQFDLAYMLAAELQELGAVNAHASGFGYVYATIPENIPDDHPAKGALPVLGLMAHMDTSPSQPGLGVNPRIIYDYKGQDVGFPDDPNLTLEVSNNKDLLNCKGFTIITAGGKTLLGADDKAGIAEIMTVAEYLVRENIPHGEIRVCFNPDEEIGRGTTHLDMERFNPRYAFTLDGGKLGEIEDECFNAASATVTIAGVDVHPGQAKNKMVNSIRVLAWLIGHLPANRFPENTENREPFIFPYACTAAPTVEKTEMRFLLRAFTDLQLEHLANFLRDLCAHAERHYPGSKVSVEIKDGYKNMKTVMDRHPEVMKLLKTACRIQRVTPVAKPIRGGTDGSSLTVDHNIPTPNIWAGGMNMHSRLEWVPLEWMVSAVETTLTMLSLWVKRYSMH